MLVKPSSKEVKTYSKKVPYTVLQADDAAHVVKDEVTGITAYISYKGYVGENTIVAVAEPETIVMERLREDGTVVMSVCTPDLGITNKGYTTSQASQPLERRVTLKGKYALAGENPAVSLASAEGNTTLTITCVHGQPVEFVLIK